jgi:hypothetical protein
MSTVACPCVMLLCTPPPGVLPPPSSAEYRLISKKGEGTFSEVLKAQVCGGPCVQRLCGWSSVGACTPTTLPPPPYHSTPRSLMRPYASASLLSRIMRIESAGWEVGLGRGRLWGLRGVRGAVDFTHPMSPPQVGP